MANLTLPSYVYVNVTVENQGNSYETFNMTIHSGNITVASAIVADLAPGSNKTLTLKDNLFPFRAEIFPPPWPLGEPMVANVTISAKASIVAGEVDTADNVYINGTISIVWWARDLNGDGRINILDIAIAARYWPNLNRDGRLDILDIAMVAKAFGRVYFG